MSFITAVKNLISKLDPEAAEELDQLRADFEARASQVMPAIESLKNSLTTIVTDAVEATAPGLRAALQEAVDAVEAQVKDLLA